jgi:hypothetical protein
LNSHEALSFLIKKVFPLFIGQLLWLEDHAWHEGRRDLSWSGYLARLAMADIVEQAPKGRRQIGEDVMQTDTELGGVNPADMVRRCAWKTCDKSFQGNMPAGWERLRPDASRKLGERLTLSERHTALCPKHAYELDGGR